ncbi:hypothetical protein ACGFNV_45820 [Streptomyces sp. NPDC048751]|uniref:hypothetical protein n=1 Tax=Streptomyces sp. NPDC048751 TaxID=3365591 RepID=UPI003724002C
MPPPAVATDLDVRFDTSRRAVALTDVGLYLRSWGLPERGAGDPTPTSTTVTSGADSTTNAFDTLLAYDAVLTDLARTLRMRKALIATSVLWSVRTGTTLSPHTTIAARNYCVQQRILRGPLLDASDSADVRAVRQKTRDDDKFRINSTAYALIKAAHDLGLPRPGLADTAESTRRLLGDFLGSGGLDGSTQLGLYQVLEKHYAPLRGTGR